MFQRLKLLKALLSLYLNRQKGMALLERIQTSDLSAADRACLSRMLRTMLTLPAGPGHETEASAPGMPAARCRQRRSS